VTDKAASPLPTWFSTICVMPTVRALGLGRWKARALHHRRVEIHPVCGDFDLAVVVRVTGEPGASRGLTLGPSRWPCGRFGSDREP
jgi:hypothetical protein